MRWFCSSGCSGTMTYRNMRREPAQRRTIETNIHASLKVREYRLQLREEMNIVFNFKRNKPRCLLCGGLHKYGADIEKLKNVEIQGCNRCSLIRSVLDVITSDETLAPSNSGQQIKLLTESLGSYSYLLLTTTDGIHIYDLLESDASKGLLFDLLGGSWGMYGCSIEQSLITQSRS
jgi:hypothetical protein